MICAPCAAAWRTSCSALAILAWRSQLQLIWVAATVTRRGMAFSGGWGVARAYPIDPNPSNSMGLDITGKPAGMNRLHPGQLAGRLRVPRTCGDLFVARIRLPLGILAIERSQMPVHRWPGYTQRRGSLEEGFREHGKELGGVLQCIVVHRQWQALFGAFSQVVPSGLHVPLPGLRIHARVQRWCAVGAGIAHVQGMGQLMNDHVVAVALAGVPDVLQRQYYRTLFPGLAAAFTDLLVDYAEFVFPAVLGDKGAVVEDQGLPAVVPVQPQFQHRHHRHAGDAQPQPVVQLGTIDRHQMLAQQQAQRQILDPALLLRRVAPIHRPVAEGLLPLPGADLQLLQLAVLPPMAQELPPGLPAARRHSLVDAPASRE